MSRIVGAFCARASPICRSMKWLELSQRRFFRRIHSLEAGVVWGRLSAKPCVWHSQGSSPSAAVISPLADKHSLAHLRWRLDHQRYLSASASKFHEDISSGFRQRGQARGVYARFLSGFCFTKLPIHGPTIIAPAKQRRLHIPTFSFRRARNFCLSIA